MTRTARVRAMSPAPPIRNKPASLVWSRGRRSATPKARTATPKIRYKSLSKSPSLKKMVSTKK